MKKIIFLMCVLFSLTARAQEAEDEFHHHVAVSGMLLSTDSWQIDLSYHYMVSPNIGLGGSLCVLKQYSEGGYPSGNNWHIDSDYEKLEDLHLCPSVLLLSPALIKTESMRLGFFAEPGLQLKVPYEKVCIQQFHNNNTYPFYPYDNKYISSKRGDWYAFDINLGVYIRFDQAEISAGYFFTTMDIYSLRRNMKYNNVQFNRFYPETKTQWGLFLKIAAWL